MERNYNQLSNKYIVKYNGRSFPVHVDACFNSATQNTLVLKTDLWLFSYTVREEDDSPLSLEFVITYDSANRLERVFDKLLYSDEDLRDLLSRVLFMPVVKNPQYLYTIKGAVNDEMKTYK